MLHMYKIKLFNELFDFDAVKIVCKGIKILCIRSALNT